MSPGLTMERVYDTLKRQIMEGAHAPGERLDPARLAIGLNVSATPVRDALHRLAGERLVQASPHEGFHALVHSEPGLRDLYGWSLDLLLLAIRTGVQRPARPPDALSSPPARDGADLVSASASLFEAIAASSRNLEHRQAIASVNARLHAARRTEPMLIDDGEAELASIDAAWRERALGDLRRALTLYHRRRMRLVADLVALLHAPVGVGGA